MQGNRPGVKPFVEAMARRVVACRGVRRANAGAEGINRRHNLQLIGDLDVPSGFAKNGGAHVPMSRWLQTICASAISVRTCHRPRLRNLDCLSIRPNRIFPVCVTP